MPFQDLNFEKSNIRDFYSHESTENYSCEEFSKVDSQSFEVFSRLREKVNHLINSTVIKSLALKLSKKMWLFKFSSSNDVSKSLRKDITSLLKISL